MTACGRDAVVGIMGAARESMHASGEGVVAGTLAQFAVAELWAGFESERRAAGLLARRP